MKKLKLKKVVREIEFIEGVQRIVDVMAKAGHEIDQETADQAYRSFSDKYEAQWLSLPLNDPYYNRKLVAIILQETEIA